MKLWVLGGLCLSILLGGASFLFTSRAPDALQKVIGPAGEDSPSSGWRDGLRGAAGAVLVFLIVLGYGRWRKGRDAPRVPR